MFTELNTIVYTNREFVIVREMIPCKECELGIDIQIKCLSHDPSYNIGECGREKYPEMRIGRFNHLNTVTGGVKQIDKVNMTLFLNSYKKFRETEIQVLNDYQTM